jgi:hypothetical protein
MRTLTNLVAGVLGGIAGTLLMGKIMAKQPALPERWRGPEVKRHPGEFMADQIARVTGPMSDETKGSLASALHFAYGIFWPTALGAVASRLHPGRSIGRALLTGAGLGALVWAAGYVGWLPATGLAAPVHRQGATHVASSLAGHVAYGVAAAVPVVVADKLKN